MEDSVGARALWPPAEVVRREQVVFLCDGGKATCNDRFENLTGGIFQGDRAVGLRDEVAGFPRLVEGNGSEKLPLSWVMT